LFTAVCQSERGLGYVDIFNLGSAGEVLSDLASF